MTSSILFIFLYSFKIKNSHLPLKVDMERFDFVIF